MITREQFEAHVRAEAKRKYPQPFYQQHEAPYQLREAYIAARMEHEWPLVEALGRIGQEDHCASRVDGCWDAATEWQTRRDMARSALSPYTTKPIEP